MTGAEGFRPLSPEARVAAAGELWRRLAAWAVDFSLFVAVVLLLWALDKNVFDGAAGLYTTIDLDRQLVERSENELDDGSLQIVEVYDETRTFHNGARSSYRTTKTILVKDGKESESWDSVFLEGDENRPGKYGLVTIVFLITAPLAYRGAMETSSWQATLGKRLLGLKVVDWNLRRPGTLKILERTLWRLLSILTLGFGFLMIFVTRHKQGLHDKLAGTLVVLRADEEVRARE